MNHRPSSISNDFFTFGLDGIAVHRADERRAVERQRDVAAGDPERRVGGLRRRVGSWLIATGHDLLGENSFVPDTAGVRG